MSLAQTFKDISHLKTRVILSGFLDYQKDEIVDKYQAAGFAIENSLYQEKWITLTLKVKEN
jgi:ribosomal protein L11 methylase PrmA